MYMNCTIMLPGHSGHSGWSRKRDMYINCTTQLPGHSGHSGLFKKIDIYMNCTMHLQGHMCWFKMRDIDMHCVGTGLHSFGIEILIGA